MTPIRHVVPATTSRVLAAALGALLGAALVPAAGAAESGPARGAVPAETLESVVVTGSYIRRADAETASPITVINAEEIAKSGLNSIADVIRSAAADNSGTLTQAFSGAMAGGASGISLRGMSVDATLVLVDGHRMANYPLADDGQKSFVDVSSLPMGIVDRVEILKDGASALYGSDAIAGVVNVILKKQFVGLQVDGSAGLSYKHDGLTQRMSALYGFGDLAADGRNVYFNVEYRHQSSIPQEARGSYLNQLDLTSYVDASLGGGPDLRGGVPGNLPFGNSAYTIPGQVLPANADPNSVPFMLLPGCKPENVLPNQGCAWDTNQYKKIQPMSEGINFTTHYTQKLSGDWQNALAASYFQSNSEQFRQSNLYNAPVTLVPFAWGSVACGLAAFLLFLIPRTRTNWITLNLGCVLIYSSVYIEKGMGLIIPGLTPDPLGEIYVYTPSGTELLVAAGIFGLGFLVFTLMLKVVVPIMLGEATLAGGAQEPH